MTEKRYKLIKLHPNSLELESEVSQDKNGQYLCSNPLITFAKEQVEQFPEFWQLIKEEPKVFYIVRMSDFMPFATASFRTVEQYYKDGYLTFETEKERDLFVLNNKPQFTGQQMKDFAMYHYYDDFDVETSLNNFLNTKNGTN